MWHFRRVVQSPEALLLTRKKLHQWNSPISGTCSERPPRVYVHQPFWHLLTLVSYSNSFSYRLQKTQKMTLNQQMKKYSNGISCTAQLGVKKKLPHELRSVQVNSDNLEYLIIRYLFGPCKSHKGNCGVFDRPPFYLFTSDFDTLQGFIIKDSMLTKITFIFLLLLVTVLAINRQFRGVCNVLIQ